MAERIRYLCSDCDSRFLKYDECLKHVCKTSLKLLSVEDFQTESVVSEAYRNYRYVLYIRSQVMLLFPEAKSISDIKNIGEKSKQAKKMWKRMKEAESLFLKGRRQKIDFPTLGDLTFANVCQIQKYKNFSMSHFQLIYKNSKKTYPAHYHMLWSKAEFQFWPFFFSFNDICSHIFCTNLIKFENHSFQVFAISGWQSIDFPELVKFICSSVVSPLFKSLSDFIVSCVLSKKVILNETWTDLTFESQNIDRQLKSLCGGDWYVCLLQLPNFLNYFLNLHSLPASSSVRDFISFDSLTKSAVGNISRGWIPFLCIFCDCNYILEKYGHLL
jgi:hypothetical protein